MIDRGNALRLRVRGISFWLEGHKKCFTGDLVGARVGNTPGVGGFEPEAEATLTVPSEEFTCRGITPHAGLYVTTEDRRWVVESVEPLRGRWVLRLTVSHPKTSDIPTDEEEA